VAMKQGNAKKKKSWWFHGGSQEVKTGSFRNVDMEKNGKNQLNRAYNK